MDKAERRARIIEAAAALLAGAPKGALHITNLNKAVFYLDLYALRATGHPVTYATYLALEQGPVVSQYPKHLVKPLHDAGIAVQEMEGMSKPVRLVSAPGEWAYLDERARQFASNLGAEISKQSAGRISEISHDNIGWKIAFENGLGAGGPPQVIDMNIALQQIIEKDPWLSESLTTEETQSVSEADAGKGSPW